MSDRLLAIILALLLAAPLCLSLDGDLFEASQPQAAPKVSAFTADDLQRHAEGLKVPVSASVTAAN